MNQELTNQVIQIVCKELGVKEFDLLSKKRHHHICDCRYMLIGIFKYGYGLTLDRIADILHREDHSSMIHGLKQLKKYYQFDTIFREKFNWINLCIFGHLDYLDVDFSGKEINWRKDIQQKNQSSSSDSYQAILHKYAINKGLPARDMV
jgi:hypothetical protein